MIVNSHVQYLRKLLCLLLYTAEMYANSAHFVTIWTYWKMSTCQTYLRIYYTFVNRLSREDFLIIFARTQFQNMTICIDNLRLNNCNLTLN